LTKSKLESAEEKITELERELGLAKAKLGETEELTEEESPVLQSFKIGEELILSDDFTNEELCSLKIHSIESNLKGYDEYNTPDKGMKFVALDVELKNLSSEILSRNSLNYTVRDSEAFTYDDQWGGKEPDLGYGKLSPGNKARGWVTIQVPEDITIVEVVATPFYLDPPVIIKVEPPLE